jgi:ribose transport system substrate-binding protein
MTCTAFRGATAALLAAVALFAAGCGGRNEETMGEPKTSKPSDVTSEQPRLGKTPTVGVSLLKQNDDFYRSMEDAMDAASKEKNLILDVQSADESQEKQLQQVENFIGKRVSAIILCPTDSVNVEAAVRKANDAGIPVFTADIASDRGKIVSHIASDNVLGGKLAAQKMAALLKEKGNIILIGFEAVSSVRDRSKGFRDEIAKHPGIKILEEPPGEGDLAKSQTAAQNMLNKYGPKLNGIFGINDNTALGALAACNQARRDDVVIVGYDGSAPAREQIKKGTCLKADAVQYPEEIGKTAIETVAAYLGGAKVAPRIQVKTGIVDASNVDAPAAKTPGP